MGLEQNRGVKPLILWIVEYLKFGFVKFLAKNKSRFIYLWVDRMECRTSFELFVKPSIFLTKLENQKMSKPKDTKVINGIDVNVVTETIDTVKSNRDLGLSRFKIQNKWEGATRTTTTVGDMYAAKQTISHKENYQVLSDEPEMLSGSDLAPNPVEQLLSAVASCVTTSVIAHAAVRGIQINSLESELEGDIDLNGFLGLDEKVAKGYSEIRLTLHVDTPHPDLDEIVELAKFSPVFNTVTNGAKILTVGKNKE